MVKRTTSLILLTCLLLVGVISGVALANDGRINPPPYHFGGDALYCNQNDGCTLLNKTGQFLWEWTQDEVATATHIVDETGQNTLVGEGVGTYGPALLWAVPSEATDGSHRLCLFAYDEWGKQNFMCFTVTAGWVYLPIMLAPAVDTGTPEPVADCSMWTVGNWVSLIVDLFQQGPIISINSAAGELTFTNYGAAGAPLTAGCDEVIGLI